MSLKEKGFVAVGLGAQNLYSTISPDGRLILDYLTEPRAAFDLISWIKGENIDREELIRVFDEEQAVMIQGGGMDVINIGLRGLRISPNSFVVRDEGTGTAWVGEKADSRLLMPISQETAAIIWNGVENQDVPTAYYANGSFGDDPSVFLDDLDALLGSRFISLERI